MINLPDFRKKQILFVFFNLGDTLSFRNDNVVIKNKEGGIKSQCSCYRVFLVFAVGHFSITSAVVQQSKKFGFFLVLMSPSFRVYDVLGAEKSGNTLLKQKQYTYNSLEIARRLISNKIFSQQTLLKKRRSKSEELIKNITLMDGYLEKIKFSNSIPELMGFEGTAAKIYFKAHFDNVDWCGRTPRLKRDYINSSLDIGYTVLFNFIDSILLSYGFDTYKGVLHKQFYMRKSLVCDIIEPFRVIIDEQVKKSINLSQIKEEHFKLINNQYQLEWKMSPYYIKILAEPILEKKEDIFIYIQQYYRCFMKGSEIEEYPFFCGGEK